MMKADLPVQIMRDHHVQMEQKPLHVLMSKSRCVQMVPSLHVLMGQLQGGQDVLMGPHPQHVLMEQIQPAPMEQQSPPVLMERNQGVEREQLQCAMMEQLHAEIQTANIIDC